MINIRAGIFETNSSSTHSLILCDVDEYELWVKGELLLNQYFEDDYVWKHWDSDARKYVETTKGTPPQFVTSEQAAYYDENYPYPPPIENAYWGGWKLEFETEEGKRADRKFLTFEEWQNSIEYDFNTFEGRYTTPRGEEVVAFGFYGYDG